jgi:hypothetical protein
LGKKKEEKMIKSYQILQVLSFNEERMLVSLLARDQQGKDPSREISFVLKEVRDLSSQEPVDFFSWVKGSNKKQPSFCWVRGLIPSSRRTLEGFLYENRDNHGSLGTLVEHE